MFRFTFLLCVLDTAWGQGQQTTLPYRVVEELAGVHIELLSQSNYIQSNFESPENFRYVFLTHPEDDETLLMLDAQTGELRTARAIDREAYCAYEEFCYLYAEVGILKATLEPVASVLLQILLEDINDQAPFFIDPSLRVDISEAAPIGTTRPLTQARDRDSPQFGVNTQSYSLSSASDTFNLEYRDEQLLLVLLRQLDRETRASYNFQLLGSDHGVPPLRSSLNITVIVADFNDHAPIFSNASYSREVLENYAVRQQLLQVHATDNDSGPNAQVRYRFSDETSRLYGNTFAINNQTGALTLTSSLNYEREQEYELEVLATDGASDPRVTMVHVYIRVLDVNDNQPRVQVNTLTSGSEATVLEGRPAGELVAHVSVVDDDSGVNGQVACTLAQLLFDLAAIPGPSTQYKVVTTEPLDCEQRTHYSLTIRCMDFGSPQLTHEAHINVTVLDANDNSPVFTQSSYTTTITENNGIGAYLLTISATDADIGVNAAITYSITSANPPGYAAINAQTGVLSAAAIFDYEDEDMVNHTVSLEIKAQDGGSPARFSAVSVTINVADTNDQAPRFSAEIYLFNIYEHNSPGAVLGQVRARDLDGPRFNTFTLSLSTTERDANYFILNQNGLLTVGASLDRELQPGYRFHVYAIDNHDQFLRGSAEINVTVRDLNDHAPQINYPTGQNRTVHISPRVPIGYHVITITATDDDVRNNEQLRFTLIETDTPNFLSVDTNTGSLTTRMALSEHDYLSLSVTVVVSDMGEPALSSNVTLQIIVDQSVEYPVEGGGGGPRSEARTSSAGGSSNNAIIIGLTVSTGIIVIILIAVILIMKRCEPRKNAQEVYTHTTIQPSAAHHNTEADILPGKDPVVNDDTLQSQGSEDSGKGSSNVDDSATHSHIQLRGKGEGSTRRSTINRLSLQFPTAYQTGNPDNPDHHFDNSGGIVGQDSGTYLRPLRSSSGRRQRAISESSAPAAHSPLSTSGDSRLPLWHGSCERIPEVTSGGGSQNSRDHPAVSLRIPRLGEGGGVGGSYARFSNGSNASPITPHFPGSSYNGGRTFGISDTSPFQPPRTQRDESGRYIPMNKISHPKSFGYPGTSAPTTPTGHNGFFGGGVLNSLNHSHRPPFQTSLSVPLGGHTYSLEGEGNEHVYEQYACDPNQTVHRYSSSFSVPSSPVRSQPGQNSNGYNFDDVHFQFPPIYPEQHQQQQTPFAQNQRHSQSHERFNDSQPIQYRSNPHLAMTSQYGGPGQVGEFLDQSGVSSNDYAQIQHSPPVNQSDMQGYQGHQQMSQSFKGHPQVTQCHHQGHPQSIMRRNEYLV